MLRFIRDRNKKGQAAEDIASSYLKQQGLVSIDSNFFSRRGEIDLIMRDNEYLIFIEVRYRKQSTYGHPLETITYNKQQKILKTVQYFLLKHPEFNNRPCRIDAVAITDIRFADSKNGHAGETIEWIKNAIELF